MSELDQMLQNAGLTPYRELIQHHIRRQSTQQLQLAGAGTVELLPEAAQEHVMEFIDAVNDRIGYDGRFWRHGDVRTAFGYIIQEAIKTLNVRQWLSSEKDAYKEDNHELALNIFQVATINFSYSASMNKKQRKFMGIKKGLFG